MNSFRWRSASFHPGGVRSQQPMSTVPAVVNWASRNGQRDCASLGDLERNEFAGLLPNRQAEPLASLLRLHPGIDGGCTRSYRCNANRIRQRTSGRFKCLIDRDCCALPAMPFVLLSNAIMARSTAAPGGTMDQHATLHAAYNYNAGCDKSDCGSSLVSKLPCALPRSLRGRRTHAGTGRSYSSIVLSIGAETRRNVKLGSSVKSVSAIDRFIPNAYTKPISDRPRDAATLKRKLPPAA